MRVNAKIQKWGNSLALRLSGPLKSLPKFQEGMLVSVEVTEKGLVVTQLVENKMQNARLPFSEEMLLSGLTEDVVQADLLAKPSNKEIGE